MKKIIYLIISISIIFVSSYTLALASEKIALNYNIIPDTPNNYVIDSNYTNHISFSLFENESELYYNNQPLKIENNTFSIPLDNLSGKNDFIITNSNGESVKYTYYISDKDGYLEGYTLDETLNNKTKVFIKTIKNVSVIYTETEKKSINEIENIILSLPDKMLNNLDEIKLIPAKHSSNAAGITKYNKVTLYKISSYSKSTIKNIVIHEIAHTWAYDLMKDKILDYSYTDYKQAVNSDQKYPSKYAKENVLNGNYSEDFAESVAFYLINAKSFNKNFPARALYIKTILEK